MNIDDIGQGAERRSAEEKQRRWPWCRRATAARTQRSSGTLRGGAANTRLEREEELPMWGVVSDTVDEGSVSTCCSYRRLRDRLFHYF
jgi:hypothetical protein